MQQKSLTKWILLLVMPIGLLIGDAFLQLAGMILFERGSAGMTVVNIVTITIGAIAMISLLLTPLWIALLVKTVNYNKSIASQNVPNQATNNSIYPDKNTNQDNSNLQ